VALVVRSVRRARPPHPALLVAAAATLLISVVNVMVESSDVVRYLVPFIPVILVVVVEAFGWAIDLLTDGRRDVRTGRHAVGP
jgi:hypothetical protein